MNSKEISYLQPFKNMMYVRTYVRKPYVTPSFNDSYLCVYIYVCSMEMHYTHNHVFLSCTLYQISTKLCEDTNITDYDAKLLLCKVCTYVCLHIDYVVLLHSTTYCRVRKCNMIALYNNQYPSKPCRVSMRLFLKKNGPLQMTHKI